MGTTPPPRGAQEGGNFPDAASCAAHEDRHEQSRSLERVRGKTEQAILAVLREWGAGTVFSASELVTQVEARVGQVAPASVDRILRLARQRGLVQYEASRSGRYTLQSVTR